MLNTDYVGPEIYQARQNGWFDAHNWHIYPTWMVKYSNDSIHTTSVLKWLAELDPQPSKVIKVSKQATNETSM